MSTQLIIVEQISIRAGQSTAAYYCTCKVFLKVVRCVCMAGDAVVDNCNLGDFVSGNVLSIGKFTNDGSSASSCVPALSAISQVMRVLQRSVLSLVSNFQSNACDLVCTWYWHMHMDVNGLPPKLYVPMCIDKVTIL